MRYKSLFTSCMREHFQPLVSIITPTYNQECFLGLCIESVLEQEYPNWEQIIIDDGSTDGTAKVVHSFSDPRVRYYHQENAGIEALAHTYNRALALSRGEFIAILEGDDAWPPYKLERLVHAFSDPRLAVAYGEDQCMDANGHMSPLGRRSRIRRGLPRQVLFNDPVGSSAAYMLTARGHSLIAPSTIIIRRAALESIGGFQYVPGQCATDFPTFIQLTLQGTFYYAPEVMGYRRAHSQSGSIKNFDSFSQTARRLTMELLDDPKFRISSSERAKILADLRRGQFQEEFMRGRLCLLEQQWEQARRHFARALDPMQVRFFLAGIVGWLLSWVHLDLEQCIRLTGRTMLRSGR